MRYLMTSFLVILSVGGSFAASRDIMPYGDYSEWCSAYGTCRENLEPAEAERAIKEYFAHKGLRAANIQHKGRFVEAQIYRNGKLIDKVLLDRKTGRIRSTF